MPLDVIVVRKLGVPWQPELAMGAIGEDGVRVVDADIVRRARVPADLVAQLTAYAGQTGTTPFMVVHAALAVLIARLAGTDDVAVGTPIAGRGQAVLDPLVGMFVNTLMLRTRIKR